MFCRKIRIENSKHDQGKTHNKSWRILWYVDSRDDRQQPQWDSTFPRHDWLKYLFHRWPLELPSFWNIICMRICLKSWDVISSCGGGKFHLKRLAIARYMFTIYSHSKIWYHNFCTGVWNPAAKYVGSGASVFFAIRTFLSKPIMFANRIAKVNRALFFTCTVTFREGFIEGQPNIPIAWPLFSTSYSPQQQLTVSVMVG